MSFIFQQQQQQKEVYFCQNIFGMKKNNYSFIPCRLRPHSVVLLYRSYTFQKMVAFEHVVLMTFYCYVYVIFLLVGLFFQDTFINTYFVIILTL